MPKIGIVLALDGEQKFAQGMKNAQQASKQLDAQLKTLKSEFKDSATSMEYLTKKQDLLKQKEEAYQRTLTAAKTGQSNAKKAYKEQAKALEELENQLKEAQSALSRMSDSDPGYAKQAREVEKLSAAVDKQTTNYLKAEGRLSAWDSKVNKAESDIRKNNAALEKNASDMNKSSSEAGKLADSMDDVSKEADDASNSIKNVGISLGTMAKAKAVDLAGDALRQLGRAAVNAAKDAVEVGSNFEKAMSEVEALSGASGAALDQMEKKARALGSTTKFSATEVANGFKYMSLAGWDTNQMLSSIEGVVNLAAAAETDLGAASDMVTDYLSAFGLEAEKAGRMADQMAYAQANSNTSVTQLGEAYANCAANLHAAGQDMETVTAVLEALANQGTKGAKAGTQVSAMMRDISKKMEDGSIMIGKTAVAVQDSEGNFRDLTDILRDVEKATGGMGSAEKTAALQKTFTAKSIQAVNQVLNEGMDAVAGYEEELRKADGAAADMANTMQDNLQGEVTRMKSAAEGLGIALYDGIKEPLTGLAGLAADALGGLTDIFTPKDDPLTQYIKQVSEARKALEDTIAASQTSFEDATTSAQTIGDLGGRLMELNGIQDKTLEQKYEMRTIVSELSGYIPELADAYDEETGALDLTNEQLREYIENSQMALINAAKASAEQQIMNDLFEAQGQKLKSDETVAAAKQNLEALEMERKSVEGLWDEYERLEKEQNNLLALGKFDEADAASAKMGMISDRLAQMGYGLRDTGGKYGELTRAIEKANGELDTSVAENEKLTESIQTAQDNLDSIGETADAVMETLTTKTKEAAEAAGENAEAEAKQAEAVKAAKEEQVAAEKDLLDIRNEYARSVEETEKLNDTYMRMNSTYQELKDAAEGYAKAQKEAAMYQGVDEDRYEKAVYDMTRYKAMWDQHGLSIKEAEKGLAEYGEKIADVEDKWSKSTDKTRELYQLWQDKSGIENIIGGATALGQIFGEMFPEKIEKAKTSATDFLDHVREEIQKNIEAWQKQLEATAKASADNIRNAWDQLKSSASQTLTFSIETQFDGGADLTTETMNANLQSQLDGYRDYVKNLEVLRQAMAEGIITPEFFTHLEQQGTAAANEIQHMAWTLENQSNGVEQVQGISDKWMEALDMQDQIAKMIAGDQAALADGLKSFGSSDADFAALSDAINTGLSGADADLQAKIQGLVETAQSVGATIPEGLAESIQSGDIDAKGVEDQLNASIQGAMEGLADVAKDAGVAVPDGLIEGIQDGTVDVEDAYTQLISSISEATVSGDAMQTAAKEAFTTPMAEGIAQGQEEVVSAVTGVSEAAAGAMQTGSEAFKDAGVASAASYASGMTAGATQAHTAAQTIAKVAKIAAGSNASEFNAVGANMAAGIAAGIAAGQSGVINAAANVAAQALAAAKRALDIKSPSKKFQKEVGHQIGKGMAFGIKQTKGVVGAAAEDLSNNTYLAATKWLQKYKKSHKTTLANEKYFWTQVAKVTQKGTSAYEQALINSGFGVSLYTTTGSGKKKKKVKKDAETYYGEVLSAAQNYFDRLTMNEDMSIEAELAYWQKVQASLKKGTTAYVQAAQKIKNLKQKIGGFDVASDLIDSFGVYLELSEKALMDYWDIVRRQYAEGTEDRLKADEKYLDAKKKYYDKLKDYEDDYNDAVREKREELETAITDRMNEIAGAFDLFDEYTSEAATGQELLFNLKTQAEGYQFWMEQLAALRDRGILSEALLDELTQKGPTESAAIYALNSLSDKELAEYNAAYQKKMDLARQQATDDTQDLASRISNEIESLTDEYTKAVAGVNTNLNTQIASLAGSIRTIASDQTTAIVQAIAKSSQTASQAVQTAQQQTQPSAEEQEDAARQAAYQAMLAEEERQRWGDKIKAIVSAGKKTSKTSSSNSALRNYIITAFGYDIGSMSGNNEILNKLGKLFGISVSKNSTGAQRTAILNAIRAKGWRSGTKRVPVWMDEEGLGSEMVISRADNAVLTRIPASSAIVPANLTENLWQWGAVAPAQFLAQINRQQAAMSAYVGQMVGSTASAAVLNSRLTAVSPATAGGGNTGEGLLQKMFNLMAEYLPHIEDSRNTYLDKDLVTKAMSDNMSIEMARRSRRMRV